MSPIISVAPMMNYTDRHARYFFRLIAPEIRLYTEMVSTQALIHGNAERLLAFDPHEKYLALQLGGNNPEQLAQCSKMGEEYGFDEINLNVGCPSERVRCGCFGAALMLQPQLVADCFAYMQEKVKTPVTIKCRIGVDHQDSYADLYNFISLIAKSGCKTFIIHARKAWLSGLSPKENRNIPELRYDIVRQIKIDFPQLTIILNGGLKTITDIDKEISFVDGVMLGRAAYSNPFLLAEIQKKYFSEDKMIDRMKVIRNFIPYIQEQLTQGIKFTSIVRHVLGLFQGQRGAARWRRYLSQNSHKPNVGIEILEQALCQVSEANK